MCCARSNQIGSLSTWQRFWPEYQLPVVPFTEMKKVQKDMIWGTENPKFCCGHVIFEILIKHLTRNTVKSFDLRSLPGWRHKWETQKPQKITEFIRMDAPT